MLVVSSTDMKEVIVRPSSVFCSRFVAVVSVSELVRISKKYGQALGIIHTSPVSMRKLQLWIKKLEQEGVVLAPPTALIQ